MWGSVVSNEPVWLGVAWGVTWIGGCKCEVS